MEPPENQLQLVVSNSSAKSSIQDLLHSQKELFFTQVNELENIVLTQCKLTGVNPLSQEMAAGALSIKIGKRPRDLLNPKAIKYMQSIFSIKDTIGKKEAREISALFGVTATQVKEFFTSQRSRVRKFVRLAQEKANRSSCKEMPEQPGEIPVNFYPSEPLNPIEPLNPVPLDTMAPISVEEGHACSKEDELLPTVDESDKHFVENIFNLMRKEETFFGQVKLMEWILQTQNPTVLFWFLTKGGIMILATWLSQAVVEEQTSVLNVILKVLCHLPLQKALPIHMSAVLQSVNRLRFYRASDISNRARILLSRWSKAFARSQALKKTNGTKSTSDTQDEMLLKQSINEVMGNGTWDSKIDFIEDGSIPLDESPGNLRKLESQPLKLLTASSDDTNKKLISGAQSSQGKARRKVLLVEQPCQKSSGRSSQVGRTSTATKGRPLSVDDIQKAKMRAQFMQRKYGKTNTTPTESSPLLLEAVNKSNSPLQLEAANRGNSPQMSILQSVPKAHIEHIIEEPKKSDTPPFKVSYLQEASIDNKVAFNSNEPPQKKCKRLQIPWHTPPEIILSDSWRVGNGENSKEVEVQRHRIHRERETIYKTVQEIPWNPQEPWDWEMDYDDSLTPEIPTEQLPDADGSGENEATPPASTSSSYLPGTSSQSACGPSQPEHDMELLAVLLKNPELVFALTSSGEAGNLSSEETVKLLDMIKANGLSSSSSGSLSGIGGNGKAEEMLEVSLPSPTPSSNPVTTGWKADLARNPFSREAMNNHEMHGFPGIAAATHSQQSIPANSLVQPQILPTPVPSQQSGTMAQTLQQLSLLQSALGLQQDQQRLATLASSSHPNAHAYAASHMQLTVSEFEQKNNTMSMHVEAAGIVNPSELPSWAYSQMQQSYAVEPQGSQSWRPMGHQIPHYQTNMNPNNYNSFAGGGHVRNDLADETDFESWSPHNSPGRSHRFNSQGWNLPDSRLNPGYGYGSERPISRNPGYRDPGRSGRNKRWNDRGR